MKILNFVLALALLSSMVSGYIIPIDIKYYDDPYGYDEPIYQEPVVDEIIFDSPELMRDIDEGYTIKRIFLDLSSCSSKNDQCCINSGREICGNSLECDTGICCPFGWEVRSIFGENYCFDPNIDYNCHF